MGHSNISRLQGWGEGEVSQNEKGVICKVGGKSKCGMLDTGKEM